MQIEVEIHRYSTMVIYLDQEGLLVVVLHLLLVPLEVGAVLKPEVVLPDPRPQVARVLVHLGRLRSNGLPLGLVDLAQWITFEFGGVGVIMIRLVYFLQNLH